MRKVAITGGIGSGKSFVARKLKERGFSVFSCDEIYEEVIRSAAYANMLAEVFPTCVTNGAVQRDKLSEIVFNNSECLQQLNAIAHPLIMQELEKQMERAEGDVVFAEVPLLFEGGFESMFDSVLVVRRSMQARICAIESRDGLSRDRIEKRIASQLDYDSEHAIERMKKCGVFFLDNDGQDLDVQLDVFYERIKGRL